MQADVTSEADVMRLLDTVTAQLGAADVIVNNAVIQYTWHSVLKQELKDFESQFRSCVLHNVLMTRAFVPGMIEKKFGRMIGINTECAMQAYKGQGAYVAGNADGRDYARAGAGGGGA